MVCDGDGLCELVAMGWYGREGSYRSDRSVCTLKEVLSPLSQMRSRRNCPVSIHIRGASLIHQFLGGNVGEDKKKGRKTIRRL